MKILEDHFNNKMNSICEFSIAFNSHHRNVLKRCGIYKWVQLLPIYETIKQPGFISYAHRVELYIGDKKTTLPRKLTDKIDIYCSSYFRTPANTENVFNRTCNN